MDIYLDENVPDFYDAYLLKHGWRSVKARDVGNTGKSDSFQFKYCADNNVPLITLNEGDFVQLHRFNSVLTEWRIGSIGHGGVLTHMAGHDEQLFLDEVDVLLAASVNLAGTAQKFVSGTWHQIKVL